MGEVFFGMTAGALVDNVNVFRQNSAIKQEIEVESNKITDKPILVASDKFFGNFTTECACNRVCKIAPDLVAALMNARTDGNANIFGLDSIIFAKHAHAFGSDLGNSSSPTRVGCANCDDLAVLFCFKRLQSGIREAEIVSMGGLLPLISR